MKKSNLLVGILYVAAGLLFLAAAFFADTRLSGIFYGMTGAGCSIGMTIILQYFYWTSPKKQRPVSGAAGQRAH